LHILGNKCEGDGHINTHGKRSDGLQNRVERVT